MVDRSTGAAAPGSWAFDMARFLSQGAVVRDGSRPRVQHRSVRLLVLGLVSALALFISPAAAWAEAEGCDPCAADAGVCLEDGGGLLACDYEQNPIDTSGCAISRAGSAGGAALAALSALLIAAAVRRRRGGRRGR